MNKLLPGPSAAADNDSVWREVFQATSDCLACFEVFSPRRFLLVGLNPACERTFGLDADALGKTPHEIWPPEAADLLVRGFQVALESPAPTTADQAWDLPSGRRWLHAVFVPARRPGQPAHRLAVIWRDITVRVAFEEALCDREEMFRRLVETTNVIPWEADYPSQRFTYVGRQAVKRFGYAAPEWYREGFRLAHIHPDDREQAASSYLRLANTGREGAFEYRMLASDGSVVWVHDLVNLIADKDKLLLRGFLVDVTARRAAEEEVRRLNNELEQRVCERTAQLAAANKELEAFCYSVSHDLRAPLRAIDGFSKALLEDCGDRLDEEGKDSLRRVRAASQRMGELIDDLLLLSRISRAEMHQEQVSLTELARHIALELHKQAPEREVDWIIGADLTAPGDPALLRVVLENLLGNSWKYTSKHAKARIEFGVLEGGQRVFFVRDDGAGFEPAYAGKLFQPFQRLHRSDEFEGHGIGLATVQRIIHRHGGRVWAEGAVEKGATVFFTLLGR